MVDTRSTSVIGGAMVRMKSFFGIARLAGLAFGILGVSVVLVGALPAAAQTANPASPAAPPVAALSPAQAQGALAVLQDPQKRDALIAALQSLAANTGAKAAPAAAPAAAKPIADIPLAPGSLGATVLDASARMATTLTNQVIVDARSITDFPLLWRWVTELADDPGSRAVVLAAAWRLAAVAVIGLIVERLVGFALRRPRRMIIDHAPITSMDPMTDEPGQGQGVGAGAADAVARDDNGIAIAEAGGIEPTPRPAHERIRRAIALLRRIPYALAVLAIDLLPVGAFLAAANAAAGTDLGGAPNARVSIVLAVGVYAVCRVLLVVSRTVLSPKVPRLRLVALPDRGATMLMNTARQMTVIAGAGYALAEILLIFGLFPAVHDALLRLTGLAWNLCLVVLVIRCRRPVGQWLAGHERNVMDPTTRRRGLGFLRDRVAESWHWVAIAFILGLWLVYAFEIRNGVQVLLRFLIATMVVLAASRLLTILLQGGLARALRIGPETAARYPSLPGRAARYGPALRVLLNSAITVVTLVALLQAWGVNSLTWFTPGALGGQVVFTALRIVAGFAVAALLWEGVNAMAQAHLARLADEGLAVRAVRLRTLLPMLRTTLMAIIAVVVTLMTLSEIGVDTGPLLAGAGIVGVAIGFGSQKLVQDLITGIFLLLENAMQVGDNVSLGGLSGVVEHLSIRTIRLRDGDGSVHIIPFSSVTTVTNTNRGQGNAPVSVSVAYEEDSDRVSTLLQEICAAMQAETPFKTQMTGPLQLWGVDHVGAAGVTIVGQIPCTDAGRWPVQREFNRRVKQRFQAAGIRLAVPAQELQLRHPLDVRMDTPQPVLNEPVQAESEAAA
jgi:small-conductance mechanosensitive channel